MQYGLIGEHLGHSFSREIHGQIADYEYELREIPADELDSFMKAREFRAINVTIPYKQAVIPYLDEITDRARDIGAVNTIVNNNGLLWGDNTDFAGMAALAEKLHLDFQGRKVLILGTGGTSKTALAVARSLGATEIYKVSRSAASSKQHAEGGLENGSPRPDSGSGTSQNVTGTSLNVAETSRDVVGSSQEMQVFKGVITYEEAAAKHSDARIIINTTPCGMFPHADACPIDVNSFPRLEGVIDAIYNPLRTNLVLNAQEKGAAAEGGLYMLSAQGVYACGAFLGREMGTEDIVRAYSNVLAGKRNIVLTGMPSCGKTTVGQRLAELTSRPLVDTDELVVNKIGMEIAEYFAAKGETAFRDRESEVISEISQESGLIIATGGGAVLRSENVRALKQNGLVLFLDRPLEMLITTDDRPLSSKRSDLEKRYNERIDIYRSMADVIIDGSHSIDTVAREVLEAMKVN